MQDNPFDKKPIDRQKTDQSNSQTIPPEGGSSNRPSPPPLFPGYGDSPYDNYSPPEWVEEVDPNATRVTPSAINTHMHRPPSGNQDRNNGAGSWGCFGRGMAIALFVVVALAIIAAIAAVLGYYSIASTLPSVDGLRERSAQFETTRIVDRNGNPLYEILDPNAGRRTFVKLIDISPLLVAATIATEDKDFYTHPGFDPLALIRAIWQNVTSGETV